MRGSESLIAMIPDSIKPPMRMAFRSYLWLGGRIALHSPLKPLRIARLKKRRPLKLNVGCGKAKYPGWVNIDIEPGADLVVDVTKGLPFDDESVDFIYNEHVLEHLTFEQGENVLREFLRCLKTEGVLRIAVPDLDYLVQKYGGDWKNQDWLSLQAYEFIESRGQMLNVAFRYWGHKYLYNEEDLRSHLLGAGFAEVERCGWNESRHAELRGLETRKDSVLILEATRQ